MIGNISETIDSAIAPVKFPKSPILGMIKARTPVNKTYIVLTLKYLMSSHSRFGKLLYISDCSIMSIGAII